MYLPWCLRLCVLILILPFATQWTESRALPPHVSFARRINHQRNLQPNGLEISAQDELANTIRSLSPRVSAEEIGFQSFIDVGNGWNFYYSSWHAASLPLQPAAWALTNLYASMLVQAQSTWRKGPPQNILPLVFGQIQLIMICPDSPIPWQIVENFASEMLRITGEGWTGLYQILLSQAGEDVSIGIQLTILPGK